MKLNSDQGLILSISAGFVLIAAISVMTGLSPSLFDNGLPIASLAGLGITSLLPVLALFLRGSDGPKKNLLTDLLVWFTWLFSLLFSIQALLHLTASLHPLTYDAVAWRIDAGFGFQPGTMLAVLAQRYSWLKGLLDLVWIWLPVGFPILYGMQLAGAKQAPVNILRAWAVSTACALIAWHLCPVAGPAYLFGSEFPLSLPGMEEIPDVAALVEPAFRKGFPSIHAGWALMLYLAAGLQRVSCFRFASAIFLALSILAALAKGEHYLIDLVVAVPFTIAILAYCTRVDTAGQMARRRAIGIGAGLWLLWVIAVRYGLPLFELIPGLVWVLSAVTVGASLLAWLRILPHATWGNDMASATPATLQTPVVEGIARRIAVMFFVSGFTGLMYEVIFSKELAMTFGGTATATYTVLTVYMGGMAIGAWIGGRLAAYRKNALALYAACELAIGLYCLATPILFGLIRSVYVALAGDIAPDAGILLLLRVGCGALVLLVPTVLMGMTLPILVSEFEQRGQRIGGAIARLYGANTLGAACGALLTGYFVLPVMGMWKTTLVSAAGSVLVAGMAFRLTKYLSALPVVSGVTSLAGGKTLAQEQNPWAARGSLAALFIVGSVTLILEVEYMLLLAVVAGNSSYAFSLMLFAFLLGLGAGAFVAKRLLLTAVAPGLMLAGMLIGLACTLLFGVFQWDSLSAVFGAYAEYPLPLGFGAREAIRGGVCWLMMFPPALIIGACYPIALEVIASARSGADKVSAVGAAVALNTLGNIIGAVLGGFVLLPMLGPLTSIHVAAALCLSAAGLVLWSGHFYRQPVTWAGLALALALFAVQPASFDYTALATGANVYFASQGRGKVIDHAESLDGGLTSVAVTGTGSEEIKTLLTNGKFQGNNAMQGEMRAQLGFAVTPLLHTAERANALIIGYGTGVTARTLRESGFANIDIVDLSSDLVTMANRHFANVNDRVSEKTGVHTFITDGRNYLMLRDKQYDLVSMEITSIWFAGAAALYNHEFYRLAARRLTSGGVLQQWMQLHHVTTRDIAVILGSVRAEFDYVWLYVVGDQGIIIASRTPQPLPEERALGLMRERAGLMSLFRDVGATTADITSKLVLDPQGVGRLLDSFGTPRAGLVSTDDNLFLEYSTPRGNALDSTESFNKNMHFLRRFSRP